MKDERIISTYHKNVGSANHTCNNGDCIRGLGWGVGVILNVIPGPGAWQEQMVPEDGIHLFKFGFCLNPPELQGQPCSRHSAFLICYQRLRLGSMSYRGRATRTLNKAWPFNKVTFNTRLKVM